jgi:DNA modification methylase
VRPYYEDGSVTIYHGDCLDVIPQLDLTFALGITDPPYNVGVHYGQHNDRMDPSVYEKWCAEWLALLRAASDRVIVFPGHGNVGMWYRIDKPGGMGCWFKPGNPAPGGLFQFCEWEPWLFWGKAIGGSDTIRATVTKQSDTGDHPCPKPLFLFSALIVRATGAVIDPFMGSGTALRAAKTLGRKAIGIEIEERYCEIAAKRCAQEVFDLDAAVG